MCEVKSLYVPLQWEVGPVWPKKEDTKCNKFYNDEWKLTAPLYSIIFMPEIKRVIFNGPATIVFWSDNTKTIVKCMEGELFDEEKGIAMAFIKKMYGTGYMRKIRNHIPVKISTEEEKNVEN